MPKFPCAGAGASYFSFDIMARGADYLDSTPPHPTRGTDHTHTHTYRIQPSLCACINENASAARAPAGGAISFSLFTDRDVWIAQPWCVYAIHMSSLMNLALFYDRPLVWTLHRALDGSGGGEEDDGTTVVVVVVVVPMTAMVMVMFSQAVVSC